MIGESTTHTPDTNAEAPARRARGVALPGQRRPWNHWLIGFCAAALLLNALIGQDGYFETRRLARQVREEQETLDRQRARNRALQALGQSLASDPAAIEDAARRQLGLVKEGEVLFIITDTPAAKPLQPAPGTPTPPPPAAPPARPR
ncbi:MAG: septum formation initiator family protein [Acidobacteria bacterium]|nr:septum formation initiator family protein [Acidobacteriota bacterium]